MSENTPSTAPRPSSDARDPSADEAAVNDALAAKQYDEAGRSWWWSTPHKSFDGQTPRQVWSNGDEAPPFSRDDVRRAANAAPFMGHAFLRLDS